VKTTMIYANTVFFIKVHRYKKSCLNQDRLCFVENVGSTRSRRCFVERVHLDFGKRVVFHSCICSICRASGEGGESNNSNNNTDNSSSTQNGGGNFCDFQSTATQWGFGTISFLLFGAKGNRASISRTRGSSGLVSTVCAVAHFVLKDTTLELLAHRGGAPQSVVTALFVWEVDTT